VSRVAVHAENLGKRYRIGERQRYLALRDVLTNALRAPARLIRPRAHSKPKSPPAHIWALKDFSFEVHEGEVVGVIGRNGAGKTTLLKILARVTRPTEGTAEIHGRMGTLLEVGTGFHPELTGRENVFLSGAILGMRGQEIVRRFDEIVAFAEVESFIDTPLKHYSTGMQMRLAFAVAAHLEPEILLVDEVLAVGDIQFQKKCLGKMSEVARGGRTVIFVSHQMNQIRRLCERVFWIDAGRTRAEGAPGEVIAAYETAMSAAAAEAEHHVGHCFLGWEVDGEGHTLRGGMRELTLHFHLRLSEPITRGHFGVVVVNDINAILIGWGFDELEIPAGRQQIVLRIPSLPLRPGVYALRCALFNRGNNLTGGHLLEDWNAVPPLVVDTEPLAHPQDDWAGALNIPARLEVQGG